LTVLGLKRSRNGIGVFREGFIHAQTACSVKVRIACPNCGVFTSSTHKKANFLSNSCINAYLVLKTRKTDELLTKDVRFCSQEPLLRKNVETWNLETTDISYCVRVSQFRIREQRYADVMVPPEQNQNQLKSSGVKMIVPSCC